MKTINIYTTKANADTIRRAAKAAKSTINRYLHAALGLPWDDGRGGARRGAGRPKKAVG